MVARNVTCEGGHGISIGGVRHGSVTNVTFSNMRATGFLSQDKYGTGGVRVKSYPNSTGDCYYYYYCCYYYCIY